MSDGNGRGAAAATVAAAPWEVGPNDREAWLERRRGTVGASEVAAIMGEDRYRSAWGVWVDKVGGGPPNVDAEPGSPPWWGLRDEPAILECYAAQTGRAIVATQVWCPHPTLPLAATLDALDDAGQAIEAKSTTRLTGIGDDETDELPPSWLLQAQAQMMCCPVVPCVVVAVRRGHRLTLHTIEPHPGLQAAIASAVTGFWRQVETQEEPPIEPQDVRRWASMRPITDLAIEATPDIEALVEAHEMASREARDAADAAARAKVQLIQALAGRSARLADGRTVKRLDIAVKERTQVVAAHVQTRISLSKGAAG